MIGRIMSLFLVVLCALCYVAWPPRAPGVRGLPPLPYANLSSQAALSAARIAARIPDFTPVSRIGGEDDPVSRRLLEVLIRATLLLAMALLCYRVLAPFLPLAIWALIFAVTLYPLHLRIAVHLGGRSGLAATLLVLLGIVVLIVPIGILMSSLGDSIRTLIEAVQQNTLQIPAPPETVAA